MNEFIVDTKKYPKPRSRHHNAANVYFPLHQLEKTPRYYPPLVDNIDWTTIYLNGKEPTILDIGCGWGSFLMNYALKNKDSNVLGIEIRKLLTDWINDVIHGEHINNAYALWYSLPNGLHFLNDKSIEQFFSFFPDPWVKKKHHKRRAFSAELVRDIIRLAKQDSLLNIMTDVPEVAQYHIELLAGFKEISLIFSEFIGDLDDTWKEVDLSSNATVNDYCWELPSTDQELFSQRKNIPYIRMTFRIHHT